MLHYQSTSFHDALYVRHLLGLKPAPEFEEWLFKMNIMDEHFRLKIFLASIVFYNNQYLKLCVPDYWTKPESVIQVYRLFH
jgi:hypothetical protein